MLSAFRRRYRGIVSVPPKRRKESRESQKDSLKTLTTSANPSARDDPSEAARYIRWEASVSADLSSVSVGSSVSPRRIAPVREINRERTGRIRRRTRVCNHGISGGALARATTPWGSRTRASRGAPEATTIANHRANIVPYVRTATPPPDFELRNRIRRKHDAAVLNDLIQINFAHYARLNHSF